MPNEKTKPRSDRKPRRLLLGVVVLLLVMGHISNVVGLRACERKALSWYVQNYTRGRTLRFSLDRKTSEFFHSLLDHVKPKYEFVPEEEFKANPFPSCEMEPAQPLCPFLVTVRLDHMEGILGGGGGRVYVFNFFGACFVIGLDTDWVS